MPERPPLAPQPPTREAPAFLCPHCGIHSQHSWSHVGEDYGHDMPPFLSWSGCSLCHKPTIWLYRTLIYPSSFGPDPNGDLPGDVIADYQEARSIVVASPRGAAALLRLALQKLVTHLGGNPKNINDGIADLVKLGLPPSIQQALDYVRVIGNNAVHPGQIDLADDVDTASVLFRLVNIIGEQMITNPKMIGDLYAGLPESSRDAIDRRDAGPAASP